MNGFRRGVLGLVLLIGSGGFAENWPGWRGPKGDGHSAEKNVPLRWSRTENVRWKTPLLGPGNSSPIVWDDRVFLTQATEKGKKRSVLCIDRSNGKILWTKTTTYTQKERTHNTNPYCSATPVTDGKLVIASHGSAGLVCYDFEGKELWTKDVGKMDHIWGNASSPILYKDLAILWVGPGPNQVLLAVDKTTGKTVWEHTEPGGMAGGNARSWIGSWSTPVVAKIDDHDELILSVPNKVKGFDPATGKELWYCEGLGKLVYTSPLVSDDGIVVAMSGYRGPALAVRAGGKGDVTETHRLWVSTKQPPQRIGSACIVGKYAYMVNDNGAAQRIDIRTGKDSWNSARTRVRKTWCSNTYVAGRFYVPTESGETLVFAPGQKLEILARNALDEQMKSSLAVSDGDIFVRTYRHLWCIGTKED